MKRPKLEMPARIVLLYLFFGGLWILLSDRVLFLLFSQDAQTTLYQTIKGWFFVLISGSLLYLLLLTQHTKDKRAAERTAWLASFPERNPNPIVEIDSDGGVFSMNPAATNKFPDLQALGFNHPWLAGLETVTARFQGEGIREFQREVRIGDAWYAQPIYYVPETGRLRVYGTDITQRKQAEEQTLRMKRLYATLSQVNQTVVRLGNQQELFESICKVAVEFGNFRFAWIGILESESGQVTPAAQYGTGENKLPFPGINTKELPFKEGLIGLSLQSGRAQFSHDLQADPRMAHWQEIAARYGYHSAAAVPLLKCGQITGFLNLYAGDVGFFTREAEQNLIDEMGLDISFALDSMQREQERRQMEESLRENEERLRLSLHAANQGLYDLNVQTGDAIVNREYAEMLGYDPETFVETNAAWIERLHPDDRENVAKAYTDYVGGVLPEYRVEFRQRTKDGDWKWILSLGKVIECDAEGKPLRMLGTHTDITDRKRAEEALRASEERFRLLFENNHTVMMLIEPVSGAIRNANQAAAEFYGYPLSKLCTMSINQINQLSPDEVYAERMRALKEERNYFNFQHRLSNDEIRSVEVHAAPVQVEGSTLLFSIVYDITERKRAEEERQARARQLAALLEASQSLTESLNLAEVLQKIADKASNVLGVETTAIYLVEGEHLYLGASTPPLPAELPEMFRRATLADHPHIAEALATGQSIILLDADSAVLTAAERRICDALALRTIIYVPMGTGKDKAGVLILGTAGKPRQFSRDDEDVARALSNHAALAITNARLYQDLSLHLKELEDQIVERKRAQEQFHLVVESAPNAIMLIGTDGRLRLVNAQVENYFGYDRTELIGMDLDRLIPDRFRKQHIVHIAAFLALPRPAPMGMGRDLYGLRKDGSEFPAEIGLTPLESSDESLVMVTIVDITARKQAEEKLRRHINYLTGLREVDQAIASSFDVRLSLSILTTRTVPLLKVDAAAILLLDPVMNSLEYAVGQGFHRNILHTGSVRLSESYAGRAVMERRMVQVPNLANELYDWPNQGFLKEEKFVSYYGVPLIVKGKVVGVMEVFHRTLVKRDQEWFDFLNSLAGQAAIAIDNARLWEQVQRHARDLELRVAERTAALNRTNAELEHANRAKDEFLANMSHELRTPLNSILGLSESLLEQRRDPLTEYQVKSLEIISSSGHHLLELINDVLDLAKIEAGKFDHYPQSVNIDLLCRSSLSFIKSQAVQKSISVTYNNEVSNANISADPRRLKQILVNLLTNAVKFTPQDGRVTLRVNVDAEQDLVEFSVTDSGIGIAPQDLKRLFQPFVQVDSKLNRQFEGTGLGLALVHQLTDLHGGSVHVESQVGSGSRFTVRLPWGQEMIARQTLAESDQETSGKHSEITSATPIEKGLVLLAEDNLANILTTGQYLEGHGYKVVKAHDGLEAIEKAQANEPDIILMDIQMPVMDGMEAIRRLRTDPRFTDTPIVATTALAMPGDRERCLEAGANEYMTKPVRLKLLKQTIENLLQG